MADETKKAIIIDVSLTDKDILKKMSQLNDAIASNKQSLKDNTRETEAQRVEYERLTASTRSLQKEYNILKNIQSGQIKASTDEMNGSYVQLLESFKKVEFELKNAPGLIEQNADGTTRLTAKYFDLKKQAENLKETLLLFNAGINQGKLNVGNYGNTLEDMKRKLADMKEGLDKLDPAKPEFKQAKKDIDDLSFAIDKATGKVNEFGEKEPRNPVKKSMDDAFESATVLTTSIQILTELQGDNEKASELQATALKGIAIAMTTANLVKSKGAIIDTAQLILTGALTAAQNLYTFALKNTTKAMNVMKTSIVGLALTAFIFTVAQLVKFFKEWNKSADDLSQNIAGMNVNLETYQAVNEKISDSYFEQKTRLESLVRIARDHEQSLDARKQAIGEINKISPKYLGDITTETIETDKATEAIGKYLDMLRLKAEGQAVFDVLVEKQKELIKLQQEGNTEEIGFIRALGVGIDFRLRGTAAIQSAVEKDQEQTNEQIELVKRQIETYNTLFDSVQTQLVEMGESMTLSTEAITDMNDTALRERKAQLELELMDARKTILEQIDLRLALLDVESEIAKRKEGLTESEIKLIDARQQAERDYLLDRRNDIANFSEGTPVESIPQMLLPDEEIEPSLRQAKQYFGTYEDLMQQSADNMQGILNEIYQGYRDTMDGIADAVFRSIAIIEGLQDINYNNEIRRLDNLLKARQITDDQYNRAVAKANRKRANDQKLLTSFEIITNTASAIVESLPNIPLSVLIGALGAVQLGVVTSAPVPQFAKGGPVVVGGRPHSMGGTKYFGEDGNVVEMERGEGLFAMKTSAMNWIQTLGGINQMFGGNPWTVGSSSGKFADGGFVARAMTREVDQQLMTKEMLVSAVRQIPAPVLLVRDLNEVQDGTKSAVNVSDL